MKALTIIRNIIITIITIGFIYGVSFAICDEIKDYYNHSGGVVYANDLLWLDLCPYVMVIASLVFCIQLMFGKKKTHE